VDNKKISDKGENNRGRGVECRRRHTLENRQKGTLKR
jgi:hypothetical protein